MRTVMAGKTKQFNAGTHLLEGDFHPANAGPTGSVTLRPSPLLLSLGPSFNFAALMLSLKTIRERLREVPFKIFEMRLTDGRALRLCIPISLRWVAAWWSSLTNETGSKKWTRCTLPRWN